MKILMLSTSPLRKDNTIGNTYANIFDNMENVEFANVYLKSGMPNVSFVKRFFRITEKDIIKNLKNRKYAVGKEIYPTEESGFQDKEKKLHYVARMLKFKIFFWLKDLLWSIGRWKSESLNNFIHDFKPDLIFAPLDNNRTLNNVIQYVHKQAKCKLAVYAWDDVYTLNQFSLSPFFWLDRFYQRPAIKKTAYLSDKIYVISKQQKEVYDKCFASDCDILFKGYEFEQMPMYDAARPIKMLFTGNLGYRRWQNIVNIGQVLKKINSDGIKAQIYIYSKTALSKSVIAKMNIENTSFFMGGVSHLEAMEQQKKADILVHIESFGMKQRKLVMLSFSTKLVDYFKKAKCIFAVGPADVASIDYLIENDAAVVAVNETEIEEKLRRIIENPILIEEYGRKAWECGKKNHQIKEIQRNLYADLEQLIK